MRKFFALALAVAMVLSLASVSFAANTAADVQLTGPYRYDSDKCVMMAETENDEVMRYGDGVCYLIKIEDAATANALTGTAGVAINSYKEIEKLKVKAEFEMGEDLVESVSIVKKYVDVDNHTVNARPYTQFLADSGITEDGYYYFAQIKVAKKETTSEADIIGTLEFNRKADDEVGALGIGKIKDDEEPVEFTVFYKNNWNNKTNLNITGDTELEYDSDYALKFTCDDEVELTFGKGEFNEGTFNVDVSGQGKIFFKYNTKANEAIAAANPGVQMFFVNFNNAKFNRVGEYTYEMDGLVAAYKVVGDKLVEIKGAEFDVDSVTFNTRVLESYVFANAELVNPAAAVEAPVVEAPAAVTNPSTGA